MRSAKVVKDDLEKAWFAHRNLEEEAEGLGKALVDQTSKNRAIPKASKTRPIAENCLTWPDFGKKSK